MEKIIFETAIGKIYMEFVDGYAKTLYSSDAPITTSPKSPEAKKAEKELGEFFKGIRKDFTIKYKIEGSDFKKKVLSTLGTISYGQTVSYEELAILSGYPKAVRAVGTVMKHNPLPFILPCHRVIRKTGDVGNYGGGREMKRYLIDMEQCGRK